LNTTLTSFDPEFDDPHSAVPHRELDSAASRMPAGHTLIHEDAEVAYSFFVLVDGEAEVRRRNRRVATLGPGDCFGELALILRRPRTATVTLTAPSRLLSISAHNFRPLLMTSPEIQFKLLEALAERLAPATT
jgi:CRP-like cAMP-binding protein